jgi:flagellar biosynthesis chaperone FliJ
VEYRDSNKAQQLRELARVRKELKKANNKLAAVMTGQNEHCDKTSGGNIHCGE